PYLPSDPAGKRLATGFDSERPQAPRLVDGPLELAGGNVPEFPLALAPRVAPREMSRIAPAMVGPIAAAAGDRLAIRREGEGTNPIAMPFQRPSQTTGGHVPQPNRFVGAAAGKQRVIGREGESGDWGGLVGESVPELPGRELPHQDLFIRSRRGEQLAVG